LSAERQAEIKALQSRQDKILSTGDHAEVERRMDMDDVSQTRQLLRRQAFELAKFSNRETDVMLEHDVITVVASPWASNVVHVADAPLKFGVDCSRLNGTSLQEQNDDHENSAKVAALSNGTESQMAVTYECEKEAEFLYEMLPTPIVVNENAMASVGDAEVCCDHRCS